MIRASVHLATRAPWAVVMAFAITTVIAGAYGSSVKGHLKVGGLVAAESESGRARAALYEHLGVGEPDLIVVFEATRGGVEDPEFSAALRGRLGAAAQDPGVLSVNSVLDGPRPELVSVDARRTVAFISLLGEDPEKAATVLRLRDALGSERYHLEFGGPIPAQTYAQDAALSDLGRAEFLTLPLVAALLLLFFRGLVAASLPLVIAAFAVPSSLAVIRLLTHWTDVSVFALNVASFIGIGLAVDYALLVVSRFREERGAGLSVEAAVERTLTTSGRAILVSALAVAGSLLSLLLFPLLIVATVGLAGALVVVCAVLAALLLLPALLTLAGGRIAPVHRPGDSGGRAWSRLAQAVMRRPLVVAVGVLALLGVLSSPFLHVRTVMPDARMFPPETEVRHVEELLASPTEGFGAHPLNPLLVSIESDGPLGSDGNLEKLHAYLEKLAAQPGVSQVVTPFFDGPLADPATASNVLGDADQLPPAQRAQLAQVVRGNHTLVRVLGASTWRSDDARKLVERVRGVPSDGLTVLVGGPTAEAADARAALAEHLPAALALIAAVSVVVLFLAFGSIVVPIKAVAMNVVSISASFGALVWIFQEGHLSGLLHFEPPGGIDLTVPIIMLAVLFGLSMDYEVFLLSRIKEEFDRTGDNRASVTAGLARTGSIITRAAVLLVAVVAAFAAGELIFIKELGVGMAVAITIDVTAVRALLVPATMQLLGRSNWWAPAPLRRLWQRLGLEVRED